MKSALKFSAEIETQIRKAKNIILLLDFDGTISSFAPTPGKALLSKRNRQSLKQCRKKFPVAIISGRELQDIKKRVGVKNLLYAGNHGLEWYMEGKHSHVPIPKNMLGALVHTKVDFKKLLGKFPGTILEDKRVTFAFHYRRMPKQFLRKLKIEMKKIIAGWKNPELLRFDHEKFTFEVRPGINWDKGHSAKFIIKHEQKKTHGKLLPIYIGDGLTDEDAFKALKKNAITVHAGKTKKTAARYYFEERSNVDTFIEWLAKEY